ncbi:DMT family transporter [Roseovarius albus]|nr:DMT family transporter [Roseovarius albus]
MTRGTTIWTTLSGVGLAILYSVLISGADGITKFIATSYAAPQLFALSGGIVAGLSLIGMMRRDGVRGLRTSCPDAMLIRSATTVMGTISFFYAFKLLPFADVFLFTAMIPLMAALISGPVLKESVRPQVWGALAMGLIGVFFLFPEGIYALSTGHLAATVAVICGTVSMVLSRYIGLREDNILAQVFYPNFALMMVMALALPFVYSPMSWHDFSWAVLYGICLFAARWVLVSALQKIPAYVVTPLLNVQFAWMVGIGFFIFGEHPAIGVYTGAAIVVGAGLWLIYLQLQLTEETAIIAAE